MAFTNKHVVSKNTAKDFKFKGSGARKQWIRNCGLGRFEKLQEEMHAFIAKKVSQATCLAEQLEGSSVTSEMAKARRETELKKDIGTLEDTCTVQLGWMGLHLAKTSRVALKPRSGNLESDRATELLDDR